MDGMYWFDDIYGRGLPMTISRTHGEHVYTYRVKISESHTLFRKLIQIGCPLDCHDQSHGPMVRGKSQRCCSRSHHPASKLSPWEAKIVTKMISSHWPHYRQLLRTPGTQKRRTPPFFFFKCRELGERGGLLEMNSADGPSPTQFFTPFLLIH